MEPLIITLLVLNLVAVAALVVAWMRSSARGGESERLQSLIGEKARLESDLDNERKSGAEKLALLTDAEARLKIEFENLSQKIFDEKGRAISEQNRERMEGLLAPLRTQLEGFRARVDEVHRDDTTSHATLLGQVLQLQETTNRVSADANRLAEAIKANPQQQGAWGELVVERILEASGLQRDVGYFVQEGIRDRKSTRLNSSH